MRDTSADAAEAMSGAVNLGRVLHREGRTLADARKAAVEQGHTAAEVSVGWVQAAEDALPELARLREDLRAMREARETERRTSGAIGAHAALIRAALEAVEPLWNMVKPAKPNPREQKLIVDALALNKRAVAALDAVPPPPAAKPSPTKKPRAKAPAKRNSGQQRGLRSAG